MELPKEEVKYCTFEEAFGFHPDEMKSILDDFFFKDLRELYKKHNQEAPKWMHL